MHLYMNVKPHNMSTKGSSTVRFWQQRDVSANSKGSGERTTLAINRSRYRAAVNHFNRLVECAKTKHYSDMVRENEDNPKALWNSIKKVLHRSPKMVLPDYTTMNSLVNTFERYFADKIAKLRSGLLSTDADPPVSGSYKKSLFLSGPCQRKKSLKS